MKCENSVSPFAACCAPLNSNRTCSIPPKSLHGNALAPAWVPLNSQWIFSYIVPLVRRKPLQLPRLSLHLHQLNHRHNSEEAWEESRNLTGTTDSPSSGTQPLPSLPLSLTYSTHPPTLFISSSCLPSAWAYLLWWISIGPPVRRRPLAILSTGLLYSSVEAHLWLLKSSLCQYNASFAYGRGSKDWSTTCMLHFSYFFFIHNLLASLCTMSKQYYSSWKKKNSFLYGTCGSSTAGPLPWVPLWWLTAPGEHYPKWPEVPHAWSGEVAEGAV